jgi:subtilisin family serine protease
VEEAMKKEKVLFIIIILAAFVFAAHGQKLPSRPTAIAESPASLPPGALYVPGEVLVKFRPEIPVAQRSGILSIYGMAVLQNLPALNACLLGVPAGYSVEEAVAAWKQNPNIEYAEPNYIVRASVTPNDPFFNQQYYLYNKGGPLDSMPGTPLGKQGADIKATAGWAESTGSESVIIAVVDTGVDLLHPDLKNKLYSNGIDFVNYALGGGVASDDNGHGTAVAGIVGADTNNGVGIAGVAWNCKILPVKVLDKTGVGTVEQVIAGIRWAADQAGNGVKVINISWGLDTDSSFLSDAIDYAYGKGIVIVAAAGNAGLGHVQYPADYDHVMAIAATDYGDARPDWSNYGPKIDVAAPGVEIVSTVPREFFGPGSGDYGYFISSAGPVLPAPGSGTSFAAPQVSGLAALIRAIKPFLTVDEVMNVIRFSADDVNASEHPGKDNYLGYGRINIEKAIVPLIIEAVSTATPASIVIR